MVDHLTGKMMDDPLFDPDKSEEKAADGIKRASERSDRTFWLEIAQEQAVKMAVIFGELTADDVVGFFDGMGIDISAKLGNSMGSIFRGVGWVWTGKTVMSERVSRRRNLLRVWTLK